MSRHCSVDVLYSASTTEDQIAGSPHSLLGNVVSQDLMLLILLDVQDFLIEHPSLNPLPSTI